MTTRNNSRRVLPVLLVICSVLESASGFSTVSGFSRQRSDPILKTSFQSSSQQAGRYFDNSSNRRRNDLQIVLRAQQQQSSQSSQPLLDGIRLNKVFKATHSRREADTLIESGRVAVNGEPVQQRGGFKVVPFVDRITLDGKVIKGWEAMNGIANVNSSKAGVQHQQPTKPTAIAKENTNQQQSNDNDNDKIDTETFEYIKYWKPPGITCTTDRSIPSNIIDDLLQTRGYQPRHRVYPVGRLDKETSGIIMLTSDGRVPNAALRGRNKQPKEYHVLVDRVLLNRDVQQLRDGVVITTVAQRDGMNNRKALTAATLPCQVQRLPGTRQKGLAMTLVEGRNRQIRKMLSALGYTVIELHRVEFMGLTLDPLQQAGDWTALDDSEMEVVQKVLFQADTAPDEDFRASTASTAVAEEEDDDDEFNVQLR